MDQVLGVPRLALVIPACGQAQLSARGTAEGSLGSAHQKGGHLSCLTTELSTKAAPFSRVTKGFKMRGMPTHASNYARARSGLCGQTLRGLESIMLAVRCGGGRTRRACRLQGNLAKALSNLLIPGGSAGKVMKTQKHVRGGGGRTMPTRLPSASSGGPTARPSDPPPQERRRNRKRCHFF